jgi:hypothetical protein
MSTFFSAGPFNMPPFHTSNANSPTIIINAIAQIALLAAPFPSSAISIFPSKKDSAMFTERHLANRMPIAVFRVFF